MSLSRKYHNTSDEDMLAAFRSSGDNNVLGALLQRYTLLLLGVGMKYLKDKDEAEDAVQHVFMKAVTHLPVGEISNFKGWLYILMRNHCLQQLRDKTYTAPEELMQNIIVTPDTEELQLREFSISQLEHAIQELNEEQKACINAFYLQRQSYNQIIDQTGFTFAQVKSYIQNGKKNLKNLLTKKYGVKR